MPRLIKRVLQGLGAVLPLGITLYLIYWLFAFIEALIRPVLLWFLNDKLYFPGLGILVVIPVLFVVGLLVNAYGIRYLIRMGDALMARIPLVKSIYGALQDMMRVFTLAEERNLQAVVSVDLGNDTHLIGFVTGKTSGKRLFPGETEDDAKVGVYLPMSYQIGGFTVYVDKARLHYLNIGVEEAMRIAVTGGAPAPRTEHQS